jgi:hypothetical protein
MSGHTSDEERIRTWHAIGDVIYGQITDASLKILYLTPEKVGVLCACRACDVPSSQVASLTLHCRVCACTFGDLP